MGSPSTVSSAKTLSYAQRKTIALRAMHRRQPLSEIAKTHQVSRKFVYKQQAALFPNPCLFFPLKFRHKDSLPAFLTLYVSNSNLE